MFRWPKARKRKLAKFPSQLQPITSKSMSDVNSVKKLREETGAGVMEAKQALDAAGGDLLKAMEILHGKGLEKAQKRAGREAGAGFIYGYVHNERIGVLVDLRAETDFVVRSEPFRELAKELGLQIAAMGGASVEEILAQPYVKDPSRTIQDLVADVISRVGENVKFNAFSRLEI
jgi:elongation factor Ts